MACMHACMYALCRTRYLKIKVHAENQAAIALNIGLYSKHRFPFIKFGKFNSKKNSVDRIFRKCNKFLLIFTELKVRKIYIKMQKDKRGEETT